MTEPAQTKDDVFNQLSIEGDKVRVLGRLMSSFPDSEAAPDLNYVGDLVIDLGLRIIALAEQGLKASSPASKEPRKHAGA